ncbi:MAG: gliding motility protein GldL [Bacteroidales bacterium]|nr:gliding motility protein GldL [Bacteroidales bacterium]
MGFSITELVQSEKWKKMMAYVYGWGASIVLAGALFKIQHWPGAGIMLTAGMTTEILIFFMSAFEPLHEEFDWSLVYPQLAGIEDMEDEVVATKSSSSSALEKFDALLLEGELSPELFQNLGAGLTKLNDTASKLSDLSDASAVTNEYVTKVKEATGSMTGFSDTYNSSVEQLTASNKNVTEAGTALAASYARLTESLNKENETAVDGNKTYGQQLENMNKNLAALNAVYEMQISNSNEHLEASKRIYSGINEMMESLNASVDDTKKYKEQVAQLGSNLQALNTVYGNMLAAMNIKNN